MLYFRSNTHGGDIYSEPVTLDFSVNVNPLGAPERVRQAVRDAAEAIEHYPDPSCRKLVSAIASAEQVAEPCILCGNGAAELIYAWCRAVRPKSVLLAIPTFSEYETALESAGAHVYPYRLSAENDFELDARFLEVLESAICDAVFLCQPNNPTGRLLSSEMIRRIADICRERGIRIFSDECFLDLSGAADSSFKPFLETYSGLTILKAHTKTWAMAGLRLGYVLSDDRGLLKKMSLTTQPWNVSVPAQAAGVAALKETAHLEAAVRMIAAERPRVQEALAELGFAVVPSEANFILFQGDPGLSDRLRACGIAIRDCVDFEGLGKGWYRVCIRRPGENDRLLQAIREAVEPVTFRKV